MEKQDLDAKELAKYLNEFPDQVLSLLSAFTTDDLYDGLAIRNDSRIEYVEEMIEMEAELDFSSAILFLKEGYKLARKGWNGKKMFIYMVDGSNPYVEDLNGQALEQLGKFYKEGERVQINPHIDMRAADGSVVVGWLASQSDLLAEDWILLPHIS